MYFARADAAVSPDRSLAYVIKNDEERLAPARFEWKPFQWTNVCKSGAPDFIKCDVEGAEVEVFRGAERLLHERPPLILCEMHGDKNRRTLLKSFADLGYRCEPCGDNHILAQRSK